MTGPADTDIEVTELVFTFDALPEQIGREFVGAWFSVDPQHVELFKEATYIPQNPYRFDQGGYPDDLLEGFHLLGLLDHLSNSLLRLAEGRLVGWNYGLDRVRFVSPVVAGEQIRLRGRVADVREHRDGYLVTLDCTLERRGSDRPVMVAEWLSLFVR